MVPGSWWTVGSLPVTDSERAESERAESERGWRSELAGLQGAYARSEMVGRMGWGRSPALVVVDLARGFTDPACPLGGEHDDVIASVQRLLAAARSRSAPVVFTVVEYAAGLADAGVWPRKLPSQRHLVHGSPWVELDSRLGRLASERLLVKKQASAFCGTSLDISLRDAGVDTVVVCGLTTSGCVRATAVDACGLGFRTIVVREAVGDRHPLVHEVSLFDLDAKYADVVAESDAIAGMSAAATR
jgi:maleamate amidohydrolase